jgi:hypothetical protein
MTSFRAIVNALGARRSGQQWMAPCPAHEDKSPSLRIAERNGRVLLHCFSGCDQRDVIDALKARGLWESEHREWIPREQWKADRRDELAAECWRHMLLRYVEAWQRAIKPFIWNRHEHAAAAKLTRRYFLLEQKLKGYTSDELLTEYRRARAESPEATAMLVRAGAEDIDHAHDAAALVVRILEARQHGIACAPRS